MLLPKRIELLPDESVSCFIRRLANENGHSSIGYLTQWIGITVSKANNNEFSSENLRLLSIISGVSVYKLIDRNADRYKKIIGEINYSKYILKNRVKFCPVLRIPVKLGSHSEKEWAVVPKKNGQSFRKRMGSDFGKRSAPVLRADDLLEVSRRPLVTSYQIFQALARVRQLSA